MLSRRYSLVRRDRMYVAAWLKRRSRIVAWLVLALFGAALAILVIAILAWIAVTFANWKLIF